MALQLLAKRGACAVQAGLYRTVWNASDLTDLLDGELLDIAQHHQRAVLLVERVDGGLEHLLELRPLERLVGPRWSGRAAQAPRLGVRDVVVELAAIAVVAAGQVLDAILGVIDGYTIQPRRKLRFFAEGVDGLE